MWSFDLSGDREIINGYTWHFNIRNHVEFYRFCSELTRLDFWGDFENSCILTHIYLYCFIYAYFMYIQNKYVYLYCFTIIIYMFIYIILKEADLRESDCI